MRNVLYKNEGTSNRWLSVKLEGETSNRSAIGARIHLVLKNAHGELRHIYRTVCSGGSYGASPLEQHIGIGSDMEVASMTISWPSSHTEQVFHDVQSGRRYCIGESDSELQ
jgi:hypothetical protein